MRVLESIPNEKAAKVRQVAQLLQQAGGRALLVGGCVRDGLIDREAKDIDMEVYGLKVEAVEAALQNDFRLDTVGRAFGVLILKGEKIDLALPLSLIHI